MIDDLEVPGDAGEEQRGDTIAERLAHRVQIAAPDHGNEKLKRLLAAINADDELYALWLAANVNAMDRLGMTDHGPVHVKIVLNIALKLLRLLNARGIPASLVSTYKMEPQDAEVVVALAALLHDVGMSIHRADHEAFSLFVTQPKIKELLAPLYDTAVATILRAEVLHAIIAHRSGGKPLTLEAGIVRIADALDMAKGRSRISIAAGSMSIHSVSAAAIENVRIERGEEKPIRLTVSMLNSAGLFQLDQLFREKLSGSGLEPHIELEAKIEAETEARLVEVFRL